jgi:hypothetical protein
MAQNVRIYVRKQIRLDRLNFSQRNMYTLGQVTLRSVLNRVSHARNAQDQAAAPLKNEIWKRIKMSRGLRPIRDLRGTGMMTQKTGNKKGRLKNVGHLLDQILVRSVSNNTANIEEPSTQYGRWKARAKANRAMLMLSPSNRRDVINAFQQVLNAAVKQLVISK